VIEVLTCLTVTAPTNYCVLCSTHPCCKPEMLSGLITTNITATKPMAKNLLNFGRWMRVISLRKKSSVTRTAVPAVVPSRKVVPHRKVVPRMKVSERALEKRVKTQAEAAVFFKDLLHPFDSSSSESNENGQFAQHESNIQLLSGKMHEDNTALPKDFNKIKDAFILRRKENATEDIVADHVLFPELLCCLLRACKKLKDPKFYLSILYMLQGSEWKTLSIRVLGKFLECMTACGWYELMKDNVRTVFGGGKEFTLMIVLNLVQAGFEKQDYGFVLELLNSVNEVSAINKSLEDQLLSILRESLKVGHEETMEELVRRCLVVLFMKDDPDGWSVERATVIRDILKE